MIKVSHLFEGMHAINNLYLILVQFECCLTESDTDSSDGEDFQPSTSTQLSHATIAKFNNFFREIISDYVLENFSNRKIGGPGLVVEIDESMFGKRYSFAILPFTEHWF